MAAKVPMSISKELQDEFGSWLTVTTVGRQAGSYRATGQKAESWHTWRKASPPITGAFIARHASQLPLVRQWPSMTVWTDASAPQDAGSKARHCRAGHCLKISSQSIRSALRDRAAVQGPAMHSLPEAQTLSAITTAVQSSEQLLDGGITSLRLNPAIPPVGI